MHVRSTGGRCFNRNGQKLSCDFKECRHVQADLGGLPDFPSRRYDRPRQRALPHLLPHSLPHSLPPPLVLPHPPFTL